METIKTYAVVAYAAGGRPVAPSTVAMIDGTSDEAKAWANAQIAEHATAEQFGEWVERFGAWSREGRICGYQIEEA